MTGTVKLTVVETDKTKNVAVLTNLKDVSNLDKCALIDALARGLEMSDEDLIKAVILRKALFGDAKEISV